MVALAMPKLGKPHLPRAEAKPATRVPKIRRERVFCYDYLDAESLEGDTQIQLRNIWQAFVPLNEMLAHFPKSCRWTPDTRFYTIMSTLMGAMALPILLVGLLTALRWPPVPAIMVGTPVGLMFGAPIGWLLAPVWTPKPFWTVRRVFHVIDGDVDHGSGEIVRHITPELRPLTHTNLQGEKPRATDAPKIREWYEEEGIKRDPVFMGDVSFANANRMEDVTTIFANKPSIAQKVQLGLVALVAVACVIAMFFLVISRNDSPPPTVDDTAAPVSAEVQ